MYRFTYLYVTVIIWQVFHNDCNKKIERSQVVWYIQIGGLIIHKIDYFTESLSQGYTRLDGDWDMGSLGLESIFISNVCDCVDNTIISGVWVWSTDNDSFLISSDVLQLSFFLVRFAIAGLNAVNEKIKEMISFLAKKVCCFCMTCSLLILRW